LNNQSGKRARNGFELYRTTDADPTTASKGVGLGDLEMLCDPAPIEIGNRLWKDTDEDGIQDADEPGIDGIDVVLTCGADTATVKTVNGGQFLFSNATNATFMSAGESCKITVASAGQTPLDGLSVTTPNADGVTDNNATTDLRDSDATAKGDISFTVGNAGENNHTLDIGYKSAPATPMTDLKLEKSVDKKTVKRGDTVVYTLTATNESSTDATGVVVTDKLPANVQWVSDDSLGTYVKETGVWTIGDVAKNASKTLNVTVTIQ